MKPAYANLELATGVHIAGIRSIQIIPKEFIDGAIEPDFYTGKVITTPLLVADKNWLTIELTEDSYEYEEKPKSGNAGDYYEISIGGMSNTLTPAILQVLETLRRHEFVCIVSDRQKLERIIGNEETGMVLQITTNQKNNQGGKLSVAISLSIELEESPPYYEP